MKDSSSINSIAGQVGLNDERTETAELSPGVVGKTAPATTLREVVSDIAKVTDLNAEISAFSSKQAEKITPIGTVTRSRAADTEELSGRVERLCRTLQHLTLRHSNPVSDSRYSVGSRAFDRLPTSALQGESQPMRIVLNDGTLVSFDEEDC